MSRKFSVICPAPAGHSWSGSAATRKSGSSHSGTSMMPVTGSSGAIQISPYRSSTANAVGTTALGGIDEPGPSAGTWTQRPSSP